MGFFDLLNKDKLEKEISRYEELSSQKPDNPSIRNTLGDLYVKKGITEKAAKNYQESVSLFLKLNQKEKAIALLRKLISYDCFDNRFLDGLLSELLTYGFKTEAIRMFLDIAKKALANDRELAFNIIKKINKIDPENQEIVSFLAQINQTDKSTQSDTSKNIIYIEPTETQKISTPSENIKDIIPPLIFDAEPEETRETKEELSEKKIPEKQKINIKFPEEHLQPQKESETDEETSAQIKDKFIAIAKEKWKLESIILQQSSEITKLEKDNSKLTQNLKQFAEMNSKLKEKLLDLDILRNMEISELKKNIENIMAEKKKLIPDKEKGLQDLDNNKQNIFIKEKQQVELLLQKATKELEQKDQLINELREKSQFNEESSDLQSRFRASEEEKDSLRVQVNNLSEQILTLQNEKTISDQELEQKIHSNDNEISDLKNDIDELTTAMEIKIHDIERLNEEISVLNNKLNLKDNELNERVQEHLLKINQLSESIDDQMEELSLTAKELSDVNNKLSTANDELINKDEIMRALSEAYQNEKNTFTEKLQEFEKERESLQRENSSHFAEIEQKKESLSEYISLNEQLHKEKKELEDQLAETSAKLLEIENDKQEQLAAISSKDHFLAELQAEHNNEISLLKQNIKELQTEISDSKMSFSEKENKINELSKEREELLEKNTSLQDELSKFRDETDQLNTESSQQYNTQISLLTKEVEDLKTRVQEAANTISEKEEEIGLLSTEKNEFSRKVVSLETDNNNISHYQEDIRNKEEELKKVIEKISALEKDLESSINENLSLKKKLEESVRYATEARDMPRESLIPKEETIAEEKIADIAAPKISPEAMPEEPISFGETIISKEKKSWASVLAISSALVLVIAFVAFLFIHFNERSFLKQPVFPQEPQFLPEIDENLSYEEIYDIMTRTKLLNNINFQATLLTESLLRKDTAVQNNTDFDFNKFLYFKIHLSASKEGLSKELIEKPADFLNLRDRSNNLLSANVLKNDLKTYYRREKPISVTFLAAFSKEKVASGTNSLELIMNYNKQETSLSWDEKALKHRIVLN